MKHTIDLKSDNQPDAYIKTLLVHWKDEKRVDLDDLSFKVNEALSGNVGALIDLLEVAMCVGRANEAEDTEDI